MPTECTITQHLTHIWDILHYYPTFNPYMEHSANSAEPDQTPHSAASDQALHYLLREASIRIWIKMKNTTQQPFKLKVKSYGHLFLFLSFAKSSHPLWMRCAVMAQNSATRSDCKCLWLPSCRDALLNDLEKILKVEFQGITTRQQKCSRHLPTFMKRVVVLQQCGKTLKENVSLKN